MPRVRPRDRIDHLVAAATDVFIRSGGYARTQIGDVARAMGVAKGTVYLYVESKDALFDLVLRCADGHERLPEPGALPVPTPAPGSTLAWVTERIHEGEAFPALAAAARGRPADAAAELRGICAEIYDLLAANKTAIKLIGASAHEMPELAEVWYGARARSYVRLTDYIEDRVRRGAFARVASPAVAARLIVETLTHFAVHRHWDPSPLETELGFGDEETRSTALAMTVRGLVPTGGSVS